MKDATREHDRFGAETTVGEIVAEDYRAAQVFERHGIDFCCGGHITLAAACGEKGLDASALLRELSAAASAPGGRRHDYAAWDLAALADYIVDTHHAYLNENTDQLAAYADKIAEVHGDSHPEVKEIAAVFGKIATDLSAHLREEEEVLFPAVKRIEAAREAREGAPAEDLETIRGSLDRLDRDHQVIGDAVHTLRRLSGDYAIPGDVCNTFAVTYRMLREFEDDLHKHVHLENNILFPKAARL